MSEQSVKLRIGSATDYLEHEAPIPCDDAWHQVHAVMRVRRSKDGKVIWAGSMSEPAVAWFIDGEGRP